MRRSSLGAGGFMTGAQPVTMEELCFFGANGSLTPNGDLVLETRAWRERLFTERDASRRASPAGQALGRDRRTASSRAAAGWSAEASSR